MKAKLEAYWVGCLLLVLLFLVFMRLSGSIETLESRIEILEYKASQTVEIHVERAYDADMAAYGYKMIAVLPKAEKEIP